MKALLPVYCRIVGYVILLLSVFVPVMSLMFGYISDSNLLLVKEMVKCSMIIGLLMILLAYTKNENEETELIRIKAMRNGFVLTLIYLFLSTLYRLYQGNIELVDTSSFIIFMVMNVLCLEYGIKKTAIDKIFKK